MTGLRPLTERDWHAALARLLTDAQLGQPDQLGTAFNRATRPLGVSVTTYLVNLEQRKLLPLPEPGTPAPDPVPVDGTLPGHVFASTRSQASTRSASGPARIWVPLVDGTERLGVLDVRLHDGLDPLDPLLRDQCEIFAELAGHLIASKLTYGDTLHQIRRTRPLDPAAELIMTMLPPQTFTCDRLVITATLEPAYSVGGDAYDYAVDGDSAKVMILDAMGRGMYAAMTSAVALSAMRSARRDGHGLYSMARAADEAILGQFRDGRFVTGLLIDLDLGTGTLRYLNAGHWPAVVLRRGKFVRTLDRGRRLPLGMDDPLIDIAEERLEPGDAVLLYTDGITEARDPDGEQFGLRRLTDLAERHAAEGLPAPEKLRRLSHSVIEHLGGPAHDDATLLLLEWSAVAARKTLSITAARNGKLR